MLVGLGVVLKGFEPQIRTNFNLAEICSFRNSVSDSENSAKSQKTVIAMVTKPSWKANYIAKIIERKGTGMMYYLW